jgi:hypothetical protein
LISGRKRQKGRIWEVCSIRSKLTQQQMAAESAYRNAVSRMKELRGPEFERAWRLSELKRASLQQVQQALLMHDREHLCGSR